MTRRCFEILTPATLWLWLAISGAAAQETVLFSFNGADGASPQASLLRNQGKLFGTTLAGGSAGGFGTVFKLSPATGGGWIEETIYRFAGGTDGSTPFGNLIADVYGNLYGTTYDGGANGDYGTAFELSPTQGGKWTKKVIYNFGAYPTDGQAPRAGLIFNSNGHLYGTTYFGGSGRAGIVFELTPSKVSTWTEKVVHTFSYDFNDGSLPAAGLTIDSSGNLFGCTSGGGGYRAGVVFELVQQKNGTWTETLLHQFATPSVSGEGQTPFTNLILDSKGNIYGTTVDGGLAHRGTVFELSPDGSGGWKEMFYDLTTNGVPSGGLVMDTMGNLYGTTLYDNGAVPSGTVFKLTHELTAAWTIEIPHTFLFPGEGTDGSEPFGGLIFDSTGTLYGTTAYGGTYNSGAVYKLAGTTLPSVATKTSLTANPANSPVAGEPITLTAIVTPVSGIAIPNGIITFTDPAGGNVTVPLIAGKAVYVGETPSAGTYSVYATFSSETNFAESTSPILTLTSHD